MLAPPKPPSHDELEALIKEARARQLRRRLLGAAGVAIAAAGALTLHALTIGGDAHRAVDNSPGAGITACRSAQLSASIGFQAATQIAVGAAELRNISDSACSLPTVWPRVRLTADGRVFVVAQQREPGPWSGTPARVLLPGERAEIGMQWGNWCATPHRPVARGGAPLILLKVNFVLRFGAGLVAAATTTGTPPCLGRGLSSLIVGRTELTS